RRGCIVEGANSPRKRARADPDDPAQRGNAERLSRACARRVLESFDDLLIALQALGHHVRPAFWPMQNIRDARRLSRAPMAPMQKTHFLTQTGQSDSHDGGFELPPSMGRTILP